MAPINRLSALPYGPCVACGDTTRWKVGPERVALCGPCQDASEGDDCSTAAARSEPRREMYHSRSS